MNISEHICMLKIQGENGFCYPIIIHDDNNLIIVDTGYPLQINLIKEAIEQCGYHLEDIDKIIFTHQDIDHIGCAKELIKISPQIEVMAHEKESPYIDGRLTPIKLANLDTSNPFYNQLKAGFDNRRIKIDRELKDGDFFSICGGIEIIHTPGHTPGHICIYIHDDKVLITGDAVNLDNGKLTGANPQYTDNMMQANESIKKLYNYHVETVLTYHGGNYNGSIKDLHIL